MFERPRHIPPDYLELVLPVVKEFSGWRADRFVVHKIPRLSRNRVQKILKNLAFDMNGRPVKPNRTLRTGENIILYKAPPDEPMVKREFEIIFEDEWYAVVDKPPGLPVHPSAKYLKNTLTSLLEERFGKEKAPTLVHRLDSETSGIVLCAKNKEAERKGKELFARRKIQKQYKAIVRGSLEPEQGRIEYPISRRPDTVVKARMWCKNPEGLPSLTEYRTIAVYGDISFVLLKPRTGRQHQLRVHLDHIGHTILGDKLYGPDEDLFLDYIQTGLTEEIVRRAGHERQALHACSLEFVHPFTEHPLSVESPLPEDMTELLK